MDGGGGGVLFSSVTIDQHWTLPLPLGVFIPLCSILRDWLLRWHFPNYANLRRPYRYKIRKDLSPLDRTK